ncbi:hypothetical protein Tco_1174926 [Tanacetum coccineum]
MSSSSAHSTITYTSKSDIDGPPFGIDLVPTYEYKSDASEAALQLGHCRHLYHLLLYHLITQKTPCRLRMNLKRLIRRMIPEEYPSKEEKEEELPTPATYTPAIADLASPSEKTEPFEEDEVASTPPSHVSLAITLLSQTRLRRARKSVRSLSPLPPSIIAHIKAWLAAPAPPSLPPSSLSPLSSPLPRIPSPPLPSSPTRLRLRRDPQMLLQDNLGLLYPKDAQDDRAVLRARIASLEREARYLCTRVETLDQEAKMPPKKNYISATAIEELITQRVTEALTGQDANRNSEDLQNCDSNSAGRGERTTRYCTYRDFFNY